MTQEMWIAVIVFAVGLFFLAAAFFKQSGKMGINQPFAFMIGGVLAFAGIAGFYMQYDAIAGDADDGGTQNIINVETPGVTAELPSFTIAVANGTVEHAAGQSAGVTIPEDEESVTLALKTVGAGSNNFKNTNYTSINFTITPVAPVGATADSLATIYFESDYDMKWGGEPVLYESGGTYWANWTYAAGSDSASTIDYAGSMTMLMTESSYAEINYKLDSGTSDKFSAEINEIGDSGSWDVTFHNADWSWSQTVPVNWICVAVS